MKICSKPLVALIALMVLALALGLAVGCGGNDNTPPPPREPDQTTQPSVSQYGEMGKVLLVVADQDFNEVEYNTAGKTLADAGYQVVVANASGVDSIGSSQGIAPVDTTIDKVKAGDYAAVVIVGGMGATQYFEDPQLRAIVQEMDSAGKVVSAICVAPVVLANAGVLQDKEATVSQGMEGELTAKGAVVVAQPVVVDGLIITGWGPDAANEFAQAVKVALTP